MLGPVNCRISRRFLYLLPPGVGEREAEKLEQEVPEFQIDELFEVPGVGTVCGGLVTQVVISTLGEAGSVLDPYRYISSGSVVILIFGSEILTSINYGSGQIQTLLIPTWTLLWPLIKYVVKYVPVPVVTQYIFKK